MRLAFVFAALVAWTFPAVAANCVPETKVRSDIAAWREPVTVAAIEGAEAKMFLRAFNSLPPASNISADKILLVEHKIKPNALLVLFVNDCALATIAVPNATVRLILNSI